MLKIILRSVCAGVAAVALGTFIVGFIALSLAAMSTPSQPGEAEVGWDLITFAHQWPLWVWLFPLAFFAIGFLIGFRYFSKRARVVAP
jgi:hypothetical protein